MPSPTLRSEEGIIQLAAGAAFLNAPGRIAFISHDSEKFDYVQVNTSADRFDLHISNDFQTLLTFAEAYSALGYSVIPLLGDRDSGNTKAPAVAWSKFQQVHASLYEHNQWFNESQFAGIGIVTGHISKLVVLDFDSEAVFTDFRTRFPDLIDTHTVRSAGRQLPHLYFKLPDRLHIESMKGQGIDVLSNGRFVVVPPTSINGQEYKIVRGGMPKQLTEHDIRRIQAFLASFRTNKSAHHKVIHKAPKPILIPFEPRKATHYGLVRLYESHCRQTSRNEALFRTSLFARDTGWTTNETYDCLSQLHAQQVAPQSHSSETAAQRQREAFATIRSAFSKPARAIYAAYEQGALSNSVREALMQLGMTFVVRTYEGLLQKGIQPGHIVMAQESIEHLKGLVGQGSIWNALKAEINGKRLFPPVTPPRTANAVATDPNQIESDKCLSEVCKNRHKVKIGRPNHFVRIPTNEELCDLLGVKRSTSDVLEHEDLTSASKTRMALHRELIKRRPGSYPLGWLARRLGVNRRTIATYNLLIPINSKEMHIETTVNWGNIERLLPMDEPIQGAVLVGKGGKRYPALRAIASRLLARAEVITLKQQTANFYWYGDIEPQVVQPQKQPIQDISTTPLKHLNLAFSPSEQLWTASKASQYPATTTHKSIQKTPNKPLPKHFFQRPLADQAQEALAAKVYTTLNQLSGKVQLSKVNARRVAFTCSATIVEDTLKQLSSPSFVKRTHSPTGLFLTLIKGVIRGNI